MDNNDSPDIPLRHNNAASRQGVVVCVQIEPNINIDFDVEENIMRWVEHALREAHCELDTANMWHYVYGVRHDQWRSCELAPVLNGIQITVHFAQIRTDASADWPVFPNEEAERPYIDAADVLQYFSGDLPANVTGVGVSALSERRIISEWAETISQGPTTFCRPGDGFNNHLMYTLHNFASRTNPSITRERSDTFGWPDYPGQRGRQW